MELSGNTAQTTEQKVAWLLEKVPATRDNYIMLLITYWTVYDGIDIPIDVVRNLLSNATQPETITRARRKIIELRKQLKELDKIWQEKKSE